MSYQTIYDRLRAGGLSETGALGLLGNWECESNCEACRVQGDFSPTRLLSRQYAAEVDSGARSDRDFCHDEKGWGLAQWTFWSRKAGLKDFCRAHGASVADETAQVNYALQELREYYGGLYRYLCECETLEIIEAVGRVCREYEQPAVNNIQQRYEAALRIKAMIETETPQAATPHPSAEPTPSPQGEGDEPDEPTTAFWPPRMLCKDMIGADVMCLQALLYAHGYNAGSVSGVFDDRTRNMLLAYQAETGLTSDGVAGPKTWAALLRTAGK